MHKLLILSRDALRYHDLWLARDTCKDTELVLSTSLPQDVITYQQAAEVTVLLTDPDLAVQVIEHLPNLVWWPVGLGWQCAAFAAPETRLYA